MLVYDAVMSGDAEPAEPTGARRGAAGVIQSASEGANRPASSSAVGLMASARACGQLVVAVCVVLCYEHRDAKASELPDGVHAKLHLDVISTVPRC